MSIWQRIETAPANLAILIFYQNSLGKGRTVKAHYIAANTVEAEPEDEVSDYNEEKDCYFTPEGWYELIDNWDEYSSVKITGVIPTHWMPLPAPPITEAENQESK